MVIGVFHRNFDIPYLRCSRKHHTMNDHIPHTHKSWGIGWKVLKKLMRFLCVGDRFQILQRGRESLQLVCKYFHPSLFSYRPPFDWYFSMSTWLSGWFGCGFLESIAFWWFLGCGLSGWKPLLPEVVQLNVSWGLGAWKAPPRITDMPHTLLHWALHLLSRLFSRLL